MGRLAYLKEPGILKALVTAELVSTEMYMDGFKAKLEKDTSYKGVWTVGFTLREM